MKARLFLILFIPSTASLAQTMPSMDSQAMQNMMGQLQEAQACMEKIDQQALQQVEKRAKQLGEDLTALCNSGNHQSAQAKAIIYARNMASDPVIRQIKTCSEPLKGIAPPSLAIEIEKRANGNICDNLANQYK